MTDGTTHPHAARSPRRSRAGSLGAALLATTALAVGPGVGTAHAQAAASQYASPSVTATTTAAVTRVDFAAFGSIDASVRQDVLQALTEAGLRFRAVETTEQRIAAFLALPSTKALADGPRAVGRVVGGELTTSSTTASQVFTAIFETTEAYRPFTATVLTRAADISSDHERFLRGVATGFGAAGVPAVYVERSDAPRSYVARFRGLPGVSVVDDIDTDDGKRRLVALLTRSSTTTGASAVDPGIAAKPLAAVGTPGSGSTGPLVAIAIVLGAALFTISTAVTRQRRRQRQ